MRALGPFRLWIIFTVLWVAGCIIIYISIPRFVDVGTFLSRLFIVPGFVFVIGGLLLLALRGFKSGKG
jgi:hypothetical protein